MATNIQTIKTFPQLIKYLRTDLGWPVDEEDADNLTFDYDPEELGLDEKSAVKVRSAKQLRPLVSGQPWGIFWVDFEPKKLPVTVMRRILNQLVAKKRGAKSNQATWNLDDLLFISAVGSEKSDQREITFAHFHQEQGDLPTLRVLGWDGDDTRLKIDDVTKTLKEKLRWPQNPKDVETWRVEWSSAFKHKLGHSVKTADELAHALAALAGNIRGAAQTLMAHESEAGRLRKLHKAFQTALIHDLSEEDFADTYAQTITYGLLTAAVSRESGALVADDIAAMVPNTNPFLKEMLPIFLHAGGRKGKAAGGIDFDELGIQDVVELLRSDDTDLQALLRDFGNKTQSEDPVVYFYEHFLTAYDKALRMQRGVFYTPKPAVAYIVRGVHELLQSEFGLEDGLAATITWGEMARLHPEIQIPKGVASDSFFVTILDPATGTATFLVEVVDVVERTMKSKWARELRASKPDERAGWQNPEILRRWNEYVAQSLLPRLYGYELMMAPYAIAHMKLGLKLHESGYRFASDQRANIYLTNALEEPSQLAKGAASLFEALGHEAQAVNDVKRHVHFTVVIGNPPYSNFGQMNRSDWILGLLEDYKKGLNEKKLNLDDDFIKFVRATQYFLCMSGYGLAGLITNNTFVDGATRREMRHNLLDNFTQIHILDCHGNSIEREISPDGNPDENVFDIRQGVAISFLTRQPKGGKEQKDITQVLHADLYGSREMKYSWLISHSPRSTNFTNVSTNSPLYRFQPQQTSLQFEYETHISLSEIFILRGSGVSTDRDDLCFDFDKNLLKSRLQKAFSGKYDKRFAEEFRIVDSSSYDLTRRLQTMQFDPSCIQLCLYRLFDSRWLYYQQGFTSRPAWDVMQHLMQPNLALLAKRQARDEEYSWFFVANSLVVNGLFSIDNKGREQIFPLYLLEEDEGVQSKMFKVQGRQANLSPRFTRIIEKQLELSFIPDGIGDLRKTFGPEDVFHYMYAVFHSPTYRSRYAEFLKIDFPRLPLTSNVALFRQLCGLGKELVGLHLLEFEGSKLKVEGLKFVKGKTSQVAKGYPKYEDGKVYVNEEHYFDGVREDVWEFHIGGYQVCEKWLKDRRGRELSAEDIVHYGKVVVALGETIRLMGEVDGVIESAGGWAIR